MAVVSVYHIALEIANSDAPLNKKIIKKKNSSKNILSEITFLQRVALPPSALRIFWKRTFDP